MASIESVLQENRLFAPSQDLVSQARISGMAQYQALCAEAERDFEGFWARLAREHVVWEIPFTQTLNQTTPPFFKWFEDGVLNVSYNCLDKNLSNGNADKEAIIYEADDGKVSQHTYRDLYQRVCQMANAIKSLGYKKGERAIIYMPMSVEAVVAMQACARLGLMALQVLQALQV